MLVLEAALSTFHSPAGNPDLRGEFERGRGWYWGPGAVSLVAAQRFLRVVSSGLPPMLSIPLAEAFLSNKPKRTKHSQDALTILENFWASAPVQLRPGVEPAMGIICGVPSVRVF